MGTAPRPPDLRCGRGPSDAVRARPAEPGRAADRDASPPRSRAAVAFGHSAKPPTPRSSPSAREPGPRLDSDARAPGSASSGRRPAPTRRVPRRPPSSRTVFYLRLRSARLGAHGQARAAPLGWPAVRLAHELPSKFLLPKPNQWQTARRLRPGSLMLQQGKAVTDSGSRCLFIHSFPTLSPTGDGWFGSPTARPPQMGQKSASG